MKKKVIFLTGLLFLVGNIYALPISWHSSNVSSVSRWIGNVNYNKMMWDINTWVKKIEERKKKMMSQVDNRKKEVVDLLNRQKRVLDRIRRENIIVQNISRIRNIGSNLITTKGVISSPIVSSSLKQKIKSNLMNINNQIVNEVDPEVLKKLGLSSIKEFKLDMNFNPEKVVTFDDIKRLYITNLLLYQKLLSCDNPDDAVTKLCKNITSLLEELTDKNKKLTINDVYKLQLYTNTIAQAVFYEGVLSQFKKGAIVMGVDKKKNVIKSLDIVNTYTSYDTENTDVLPIKAKEVDINVSKTKPVVSRNEAGDIKIVLGIRDGTVIGMKIYPADTDLYIPGAEYYKVMTIKGYKRGCSRYTDSIWYGVGKIGMSHNGRNLTPTGTKGIKLNPEERCFDIFDKNVYTKVIKCESGGRRYNSCLVDGGVSRILSAFVRLQISHSPCWYGYSYGISRDGRHIWVNRGCRAYFVVRYLK